MTISNQYISVVKRNSFIGALTNVSNLFILELFNIFQDIFSKPKIKS